MASDTQSLRALEALMSEFFFNSTSNVRKREIENLLESFSQQKDAWQHCLYYMANTQNEYVLMYCCSVIETLINKQWIGFPSENKSAIRPLLMKFLLAEHKRVPHFIRNKLCKLIVDIGRLDWPHFYPDFLSNTLHLIQQSDTTTLGLTLLQTTSEELARPREDLSTSRKDELNRLLLEHIPNILSVIAGILEATLDKSRITVTATPPPSPTHCGSDYISDSHQSLFSTSPLHHGSLLSSMFKSLNNKGRFKRCPDIISKDVQEICTLALSCLTQFFTWIPLSDYITSNLLTTVFEFASFGCHSLRQPSNSGSLQPGQNAAGQNHAFIGIAAMGCINEIMSKNCVPSEFEDFLLQMFQYTFHLLQCLTKDSHQPGQNCNSLGTINKIGNTLSELDESYIEKFTEFLGLFVSVHFRRFESNNQFPVLEFLALLFKYTFQQPSNEGFFNCLDIWSVFLDYLSTKLESRAVDSTAIRNKYKSALSSLVTQVMHKFQFKYNQLKLEELDDEVFDNNVETEWQNFLRQCIELMARVADVIPTDTFNLVNPIYEENMRIYFGLQSFLEAYKLKNKTFGSETECRKLHCVLRDLSSIMQAIGRFSGLFTGENFQSEFNFTRSIIRRLRDTVIFSNNLKVLYVDPNVPTVLKTDFMEVHAQALASLKAYTYWLAQFYLMHDSSVENDKDSLIKSILDLTISVIDEDIPDKIKHSAAHLLLSITSTVRPPFGDRMSSIQNLFSYNKFHNILPETQLLIYRSISNVLLLPWPNLSEENQHWEERIILHSNFIKSICVVLSRVPNMIGFAEDKQAQEGAKNEIKWTLKVLHNLIENIGNYNTKAKQLFYDSIKVSTGVSLQMFPIYINHNDVTEEYLSFFLALFSSLRAQAGIQFSERVITSFMEIFTRDHLIKNILQEDSSGTRVIEKFLQILQLIIQEPGSAFKMFLPSTIKLCMDEIYPIIAQRQSPDVKIPLFELLHSILLYNWKFFFKSSVIATLGQPGNETVSNQDQFINIMQAFGQSFLQPDINIFRLNLSALEDLNSKWKLYHVSLFKQVMLHQFLKVLIQVLIHKSHELLKEEIGISIYNMASVDFDGFYRSFVPLILTECDGINRDQRDILVRNLKLDTDSPTFVKNLNTFVSDLRHYQLCNQSLPPGTITF